MRILFTRFPLESANGGAENQTMWLMEGLRRKGHDVGFLGSCPVLLERARLLAIGYWLLAIGSPPVTKWSVISFLWRRSRMKKMLIEACERCLRFDTPPNIIAMLSLSEKLLLTEWAAKQGATVFWIEHDPVGAWLRWNPWLPALRKASQHATIVCVSEHSRKMYLDLGFAPKNIIVIPNGVPIGQCPLPRAPCHSRSAVNNTTIRVGCIARLSYEKGVDVLIEAIGRVPEATLTIVGRGKEEYRVRKMVATDTKKYGRERVTLVPCVQDLSAFYRSLDVFVLPSRSHDPFGLVAAEAMAQGVATIVTDACGIASYLRPNDDALIATANSVESMAQAIGFLLEPMLRAKVGSHGRAAVERQMSVERMVREYEDSMKSRGDK